MPPYYKCRMCDKVMDTKKPVNNEIFAVRDKRGWYGNEWECRGCYTGRIVNTTIERDGFRDKSKVTSGGGKSDIVVGGYDLKA